MPLARGKWKLWRKTFEVSLFHRTKREKDFFWQILLNLRLRPWHESLFWCLDNDYQGNPLLLTSRLKMLILIVWHKKYMLFCARVSAITIAIYLVSDYLLIVPLIKTSMRTIISTLLRNEKIAKNWFLNQWKLLVMIC